MFTFFLFDKIILGIDCRSRNNIIFDCLDQLDSDEIAFDYVRLDVVSIEQMF